MLDMLDVLDVLDRFGRFDGREIYGQDAAAELTVVGRGHPTGGDGLKPILRGTLGLEDGLAWIYGLIHGLMPEATGWRLLRRLWKVKG